MKILVLGLGNELYGDDGVGLHAVRLLRSEGTFAAEPAVAGAEVDFVESPVSGAALLDVVRGYDALVIIDTILKAAPVTGRIRVLDASDIRDVPGPSPHYISVPQTLALGRLCGLRMPSAVKIVAVEAGDLFEIGRGLSETMKARLPKILRAARKTILELAGSSRASSNSGETAGR